MSRFETGTPQTEKPRYYELDSLRGLAALTVVLYHFSLLLSPQHQRILLLSPAKLLISGYPAVILFFLLSGFVLSLPYLRQRNPDYLRFLTKRICRIYIPYLAALGLSVIGAGYFRHPLYQNQWLNLTWSKPLTSGIVLQHIGLLGDFDWFQINTAFWSLVYEMRISLIFPLIAFLIVRLRTRWLMVLCGLLSAAVSGLVLLLMRLVSPTVSYYAYDYCVTLHYIALFIVGGCVAKELPLLSRWYCSRRKSTRMSLLIVSIAFYAFSQNAQSLIRVHYPTYLSSWGTAIGACFIIVAALNSNRASELLHARVLKHLGEVSYSLYLVHGTVLFSLVKVLYGRVPVAFMFSLYIPITFFLTEIFYRWVERPAMLLGRRLGSA